MTDPPNKIQDELLSQIEFKCEDSLQKYEKYDKLIRQLGDVTFEPRRVMTEAVPEERDNDGKITKPGIPQQRTIVYDIRPQTKIVPVRDLTDDEITNACDIIRKEFKELDKKE